MTSYKSAFLLSVLFLLAANCVKAQSTYNEERFGFGGFSIVNTTLSGNWALEVGGMGGGYIGRRVYVGGGGFGLSTEAHNFQYDMGYGGLMVGFDWKGDRKTALNGYVLAGYGGITEDGDVIAESNSGLWVVRPAIEIDLSLTHWMKLGIGGGYRWTIGADIFTIDDSDLSAPFGSITFRFGDWVR